MRKRNCFFKQIHLITGFSLFRKRFFVAAPQIERTYRYANGAFVFFWEAIEAACDHRLATESCEKHAQVAQVGAIVADKESNREHDSQKFWIKAKQRPNKKLGRMQSRRRMPRASAESDRNRSWQQGSLEMHIEKHIEYCRQGFSSQRIKKQIKDVLLRLRICSKDNHRKGVSGNGNAHNLFGPRRV